MLLAESRQRSISSELTPKELKLVPVQLKLEILTLIASIPLYAAACITEPLAVKAPYLLKPSVSNTVTDFDVEILIVSPAATFTPVKTVDCPPNKLQERLKLLPLEVGTEYAYLHTAAPSAAVVTCPPVLVH